MGKRPVRQTIGPHGKLHGDQATEISLKLTGLEIETCNLLLPGIYKAALAEAEGGDGGISTLSSGTQAGKHQPGFAQLTRIKPLIGIFGRASGE